MSLKDLIEGKYLVGSFCGLCTDVACPACELAVLRANGLPESLQPEITGLLRENNNYGMDGRWRYSELGRKISELLNQQRDDN